MNPFTTYLSFSNDVHKGAEKLKEKAIEEYNLALTMPRKKKKIAKKSAILLYSIACWEEERFTY